MRVLPARGPSRSTGLTSVAHASPSTDYVALGDSYSSGVGTGSYDLSVSCGRSSRRHRYFHTVMLAAPWSAARARGPTPHPPRAARAQAIQPSKAPGRPAQR